jgi:ubiquinone/menaquinone biosynthesis C-methylase UbiE
MDAFNNLRKEKMLSENPSYSITDLGCGSGEILKLLNHWSKKHQINFELTGVDANPHITEYAERNCGDGKNYTFITENILSVSFPERESDIITCTLFLHHFDNSTLIELLKKLRTKTRVAIVINDIHRHWLAYYSILFLTTLFSKSYMVKYDAVLSVKKAFTRKELEGIIKEAGFTRYSLKWKWAFRYQAVLYCQ